MSAGAPDHPGEEVGMDVIAERADIDATVSGKTICTIFADAEKQWGDRPALRWKQNGDWQMLTWTGYRAQVAAVTVAFVQDEGFLAKCLEIRSRVPSLRHIILVHGEPPEGVMSWDELQAAGRS